MRTTLRKLVNDLTSCLEHLADSRRPLVAMCVVVLALVVTWFVYVPIHELLHVAGCVLTGGTVSRLEIAPQYGGALLARWIPFVVSGGDYAGRLSGFDHRGSDLIYLATVFGPYLLSVFIGIPLLRACARRRRPMLFGMAIVVGLAPFYNLVNDYFEMGSIITTRAATLVRGGDSIAFEGLRSDDMFKLIGNLSMQPAELGLHDAAAIGIAVGLVVVSLVVGMVLALFTYALGDLVARVLLPSRTRPGGAVLSRER